MSCKHFLFIHFLWSSIFLSCGCRENSIESRSSAESAGRIEVEESKIDFGEFKYGDAIHEASFLIKNSGLADLEILELRTSCGCAAASITPATIPGSATGVVNLKLDGDRIGEQASSVIVYSTCKIRPELPIAIKWRTLDDMTPVPSTCVGNMVHAGKEATVSLSLVIRDGLEAGRVTPRLEWEPVEGVRLSVEEKGENHFELCARADPNVVGQFVTGRIVFDSDQLNSIAVPFSFTVQPEVIVVPTDLWLENLDGRFTGQIVVKSNSQVLTEDIEIISKDDGSKVHFRTLRSTSRLRIFELSFDTDSTIPGAVIVHVNNKSIALQLYR